MANSNIHLSLLKDPSSGKVTAIKLLPIFNQIAQLKGQDRTGSVGISNWFKILAPSDNTYKRPNLKDVMKRSPKTVWDHLDLQSVWAMVVQN